MRWIIALAAVYAAFFSAMSAPAASYNVTDLGTLGGFSSSDAMGINASGQVVGYAQTGSNAARAFLYSDGTMTDLGGSYSQAYDINDSGQIVGYADGSPFLYSNGTMTSLGTIPGGGDSGASCINDNGEVAGWAYMSDGHPHGFLYDDGTMTDLGTPPAGYSTYAYGISPGGQVVGQSENALGEWRGFLYSNGTLNDIGTLGGLVYGLRHERRRGSGRFIHADA